MTSEDIPLGCINPGAEFALKICCYPTEQTQSSCHSFFGPDPSQTIFAHGCPSGNCLKDCQDPVTLYGGVNTEDDILNGDAVNMYMACAAVPTIAGYDANGVLLKDQAAVVQQFIPPEDATEESIKRVTATVTECLTQTCLAARNGSFCYDQYCAPTRLLINATTPNQTAINQCLYSLCTNGFDAIPFANPDIIGVGIFSSYALQLCIVAILWAGLVVKALVQRGNPEKQQAIKLEQSRVPRESWLRFLLDFHKAQCYFAGTLMIAIFVAGINNIDTAMVFLLLPLTMNGVVPVVLAYLMLVYHRACSSAITLLTVMVYIVSSVGFWILYVNLRSFVNADYLTYNVFAELMYGFSHIDTCGGSSALTACPDNLFRGMEKVTAGLRVLLFRPLIVWAISTAIISVVVSAEAWARFREPQSHAVTNTMPKETYVTSERTNFNVRKVAAFWIATLVLVGCLGLQMTLLSIALSLDMFDAKDWSFGQVVAVTIWVPPVLDYLYLLFRTRLVTKRPYAHHVAGGEHAIGDNSSARQTETGVGSV